MTDATRYYVTAQGAYLGGFAGIDPPSGAVEVPAAPDDARQVWDGTAWGAIPPSVPPVISDRQFFQQLAIIGKITQAEALAAVKTGAIPAILASFISVLPADQQFSANMLLAGATQFERDHPLTQAVAAAQGMSANDIDAFFIAAYQL